jgi:GDP-L-fucose synthase
MTADDPGARDGATLGGSRVYVAGHRGMVGQALVRALTARGDCEVLTIPRETLDLRDRAAVRAALTAMKPDVVFVAAAKVGGILANDRNPVEFLMDNLEIELALIRGAFEADVERLVFLGSSCIYPKHAEQPITEDALLTGPLEPTNEWYAVAKIAGIKMCQALRKQYGARYISVMPTNLYGPGTISTSRPAMFFLPSCARRTRRSSAARRRWRCGGRGGRGASSCTSTIAPPRSSTSPRTMTATNTSTAAPARTSRSASSSRR